MWMARTLRGGLGKWGCILDFEFWFLILDFEFWFLILDFEFWFLFLDFEFWFLFLDLILDRVITSKSKYTKIIHWLRAGHWQQQNTHQPDSSNKELCPKGTPCASQEEATIFYEPVSVHLHNKSENIIENQRNYIPRGVYFGRSSPQAFSNNDFRPATHRNAKRRFSNWRANVIQPTPIFGDFAFEFGSVTTVGTISPSSFRGSALILDDLLAHPLESKGNVRCYSEERPTGEVPLAAAMMGCSTGSLRSRRVQQVLDTSQQSQLMRTLSMTLSSFWQTRQLSEDWKVVTYYTA